MHIFICNHTGISLCMTTICVYATIYVYATIEVYFCVWQDIIINICMHISLLYKIILPRSNYTKIENYHTFTKVFELPHTTKGIWAYGQTIDTKTGIIVVQNDVTHFVLFDTISQHWNWKPKVYRIFPMTPRKERSKTKKKYWICVIRMAVMQHWWECKVV